MSLSGRVAIITGGATGIASVLAERDRGLPFCSRCWHKPGSQPH